jgi:hypothetical protein
MRAYILIDYNELFCCQDLSKASYKLAKSEEWAKLESRFHANDSWMDTCAGERASRDRAECIRHTDYLILGGVGMVVAGMAAVAGIFMVRG